jgi:hypothetical protein
MATLIHRTRQFLLRRKMRCSAIEFCAFGL